MRTGVFPCLLIALIAPAVPGWAEAPEAAPLPPAAPAGAEQPDAAGSAAESDPPATPGTGEDPSMAANSPGAPAAAPVPPEPAPEEDAVDAGQDLPPEDTASDEEAAPEASAVAPAPVIDNEVDEPGEPIVVAPSDTGPADDPEAAAACEAALAALGVSFEPVEPLAGEGPCGAPRPLRVTAVSGIELRPEVQVRCPVAEALGLWIGRVLAPLGDLYMDQSVSAVLTGTGYECRRRRGDGSAKWSEHAFANAVDISGVMFESGDVMAIQPRGASKEPERSYQAGIRGGACAFFTTVLGPTTNAAHADHLHLDMAERRGGYRLCE